MAGQYVPKFIKDGDPLDPGPLNEAFAELMRQGKIRVGGRLRKRSGAAGVTLAYDPVPEMDAQITANNGSGSYNFLQIFGGASGAWVSGVLTGVCFERNANLTVAVGTYIRLKLNEETGSWRFQTDSC
jgi:hypothetical protein